MKEPLDPEICRKIYNSIKENPGVTLSSIADILDIKIPIIESHLNSLVVNKDVHPINEQGNIKYYIAKQTPLRRDRRTENTRQRIFELVEENPGLHLAKIAELLQMSSQLAEYHLLTLEKNELIFGIKDDQGYYKRFYTKGTDVGVQEKQTLALLRQEHHLKIVAHILLNPHIKHKELLEKLAITGPTLSHHLKRLEEYDIVGAVSYGKERGYHIKNEKEIVRIIMKYKLSVIVDGFKDIWKDLHLI